MEEIVSSMRYVKPKDEVRAEDTNLFVNFTKKAAELIKKVYELYKLKTGERLLLVEEYISIAETRARFLKEVKTLDIIHPDDHNLIIDTLKPIELALMEMEKRLEARTS
jgi:hypothetical protein